MTKVVSPSVKIGARLLWFFCLVYSIYILLTKHLILYIWKTNRFIWKAFDGGLPPTRIIQTDII